MRVFPVTNFSQTLLTYAGKSVSFALLSLLFVLAPAREVLPSARAVVEATSSYPEPLRRCIFGTLGPLPSYYGDFMPRGSGSILEQLYADGRPYEHLRNDRWSPPGDGVVVPGVSAGRRIRIGSPNQIGGYQYSTGVTDRAIQARLCSGTTSSDPDTKQATLSRRMMVDPRGTRQFR